MLHNFLLLSMFFLLGGTFLFGEIPEPYRSIHSLPFDEHGWFQNGAPLEACLKQKPAKTVIEVGSWLGLSTRFIATTLPKHGVVYAVDTWSGSTSEAVHMQDPRLPQLYHLFLSNVKHAGLTDKIIPIRMNSLEAARALRVKADLIYLDGAHETDSVIKDILNWYPHLHHGGIICGDDWLWPSVQQAVIHCSQVLHKKVNASGNFWWYENR